MNFLLSDHLGSTNITTDASGAMVSELRYKAWGEVRYSNGTTTTQHQYTGQYSDSYINLLDYGSRRYDPELGRFIQPDSIVPLASQGTQAWDRYGYVNNNPLRYTDPTGHCIFGLDTMFCVAAALTVGTLILTGDTARPRSAPLDANASGFWALVKLGLDDTAHANIVGAGLQSLKDDPSVQSAQNTIITKIQSKPGYRDQAFTIPDGNKILTGPFTANGPSGNWKVAAITGNKAFWMVHSASISTTNTKVSEDGFISLTWNIHDTFDFTLGPDRSEEYNKIASLVHPFYNDFLGAKESYPTDASWNQIIPPLNYSCGHCR